MIVSRSEKVKPVGRSPKVATLLETIAGEQLRDWVGHISVPRHFFAEPEQNRATADWLAGVFGAMGYRVERQGKVSNIVALPDCALEEVILVGAHYDSV